MGCFRVVAGLFGLFFTFAFLRVISSELAIAFVLVIAVLFFRGLHAARRERLQALRAQQELQERLKREAEQRAEARRRAEERVAQEYAAAARSEQERIFREWRRAAAEADTAAAEARRRQAQEQERTQARERSRGAGGADARWSSRDPHVILGVPPGADPSTVRSAYTELARQYHPDKVAHLAPEFRVLAEERMKEINSAYAQLRKA